MTLKIQRPLLAVGQRYRSLVHVSGMFLVADPSLESAPAVMESIADAVTHARFVGTETSSDEVVLVKILQVSAGTGTAV